MNQRTCKPPMSTTVVQLTVRGERLRMNVPDGKVPASAMLPAFRKVAQDLIDVAVDEAEADGRKVSCRKGCGTCCRQLVPISPMEAREIARIVDRMEPKRRAIILDRFAAARRLLADEHLLEPLSHADHFSREHMPALGREYLALDIACPFLENEACSIYSERPITCREYLVTSPAENCVRPSPQSVSMVDLPAGPIWPAVARFEKNGDNRLKWVPLILSLDFAAQSSGDGEKRHGREWAQEFIARILGRTQANRRLSCGASQQSS